MIEESESQTRYEAMDELAEIYLQRRRAGEPLSIDAFAELHADYADEIRRVFPTLLQIEQLGQCQPSQLLSTHGSPKTGVRTSEDETVEPGSLIGKYRVVKEIGQGGFGRVFLVEQWAPVRRQLAMKIIKPGLNSREVLARFDAERQSLAVMDHPNITKIFDGGTSDSGRPYFVMEWIQGVPITEHAIRQGLSIRARVSLLIDVCKGLEHAHQKGIIHRDLKPSNVLIGMVDSDPIPKIIDFGIAKALSPPLSEDAGLTLVSQVVGTPLYMSPEQARFGASGVDTRTDIYSVGSILYELLTGFTPLPRELLSRVSATELQSVIFEKQPQSPRLLNKTVSLDLETIVLKAIAKETKDRYQSAGELAEDLQCYLDDRPIRARRIGFVEQSWRWCHRKPLSASLLGVICLLIFGLSTTLVLSHLRIRRETAVKSIAIAEKNQALARLNDSLDKEQQLSRLAMQRYYATQMNLAGQAFYANEPSRVDDLLRSVLPETTTEDIRGFEWHFLNNQIHRGLVHRLKRPNEEVLSLSFSPNGNRLLVVGGTHTTGFAELYDVESGRRVATLATGSDVFNACAYSPSGKQIAMATGAGLIKVLDSTTFGCQHEESSAVSIKSMAWSPDGALLVVGGEGGELHAWAMPEFKSRTVSHAHAGPIVRLCFSRDGQRLYSSASWGGENQIARCWNNSPDGLVETLAFRGHSISDEAPGGDRVLGCNWGTLAILNAHDGSLLKSQYLSNGSLTDAKYSHDASSLFVANRTDRSVLHLNAETLALLHRFPHSRPLACLAVDNAGTLWAAGDTAGEITIWNQRVEADDRAGNDHRFRFVYPVEAQDHFIVGGGSTTMALAMDDSTAIDRFPLQTISQYSSLPELTQLLAVSDDGKSFVCLSDSHAGSVPTEIEILRIERGVQRERIRLNGPIFQNCLCISPTGRWLAVRSESRATQVFDLHESPAKLAATIDGQSYHFRFSNDEQVLVTAEQFGRVKCFDLQSLQLRPSLLDLESFHTWGRTVAFSPDSRFVAVGNDSGSVRVWEVDSQELIATLIGHSGEVASLAFFPDNERLAVGGRDDLRIFNFKLEQELLLLDTGKQSPLSLAISKDGRHLVAVLHDGSIRKWTATLSAKKGG